MEALVVQAATALMGAMITDAWKTVKERFIDLFRHSVTKQQGTVARQLAEDEELLDGSADKDATRQLLIPRWAAVLNLLPLQDPEVERELVEFVSAAHTAMSEPERNWVIKVQNNNAKEGGTVDAVQDGDLVIITVGGGRDEGDGERQHRD